MTAQSSKHALWRGIVLHSPRLYDMLLAMATSGRESAFRQKVADLANLKSGESVLDVGCGTGTQAIAAKRRVGPEGSVSGIDPSPEMIARAVRKAQKARTQIDFRSESIEALPFADAQFDVVLSTLMLHHLPKSVREVGIREICRVLKPGGRLLIVDFERSERQGGFVARFHRGHGHVKAADVMSLLKAAGLNIIESGSVGVKDLHFTLAAVETRPADGAMTPAQS